MNTKAYRTETRIEKDGMLTVEGLPFREGEEVEVIVLAREPHGACADRYPLRGTPIRYEDPFESVSEGDWESLT